MISREGTFVSSLTVAPATQRPSHVSALGLQHLNNPRQPRETRRNAPIAVSDVQGVVHEVAGKAHMDEGQVHHIIASFGYLIGFQVHCIKLCSSGVRVVEAIRVYGRGQRCCTDCGQRRH